MDRFQMITASTSLVSNMTILITKRTPNIMAIIILIFFVTCVHARVHVQVTNHLGNGLEMNISCGSRDDDLGNHVLEDGDAVSWSFKVNFWGTTLFYCDVQWGDSNWYHFDAYDADRDHRRCKSLCRWMISREGLLFGFDQESGYWESFPLIAIAHS